jgi:hypothetical protein
VALPLVTRSRLTALLPLAMLPSLLTALPPLVTRPSRLTPLLPRSETTYTPTCTLRLARRGAFFCFSNLFFDWPFIRLKFRVFGSTSVSRAPNPTKAFVRACTIPGRPV